MRQAVVIIHGIGEQRPLNTIRGFVSAITDGLVRSKPDRLSESFELRRLALAQTRSLPPTDVYELYWAHHMIDARWRSSLRWLSKLIFRRLSSVPSGLRSTYLALWTLMLIGVVIMCISAARAYGSPDFGFFSSAFSYAPVAAFLAQVLFGRIVLGYMGDAARYLTPEPANIEARTKIRSEGVRLLRRLHTSRRYSRIVVVGHSLGSVIGYDVLRHLWDEMRMPSFEKITRQPEATAFESAIARVKESRKDGRQIGHAVEEFQQKQHLLWREQRKLGTPWLVSDFVTLGSPLAHAQILLDDPSLSLEARMLERELPTCPPTSRDGERSHYGENKTVIQEGREKTWHFRIPHHGAVFSGTRWTNLYFRHSRLVMGDIIGGPLSTTFGAGIKDVPVRPARPGFWSKTLACHVMYWRKSEEGSVEPTEKRKEIDRASGTKDLIMALRSALKLESKRAKEPWPPP